MSDEHVIPEAIGGYYHIYSVCKTCNSRLGDHIDKLLLNHWFIKASRYEKVLRGIVVKFPILLLEKVPFLQERKLELNKMMMVRCLLD